MSVVNKMLRDLENRAHPAPANANYVPPNRNKLAWIAAAVGAALGLSALVTGFMYANNNTGTSPKLPEPSNYTPQQNDQIAQQTPARGAQSQTQAAAQPKLDKPKLDRQVIALETIDEPNTSDLDRHEITQEAISEPKIAIHASQQTKTVPTNTLNTVSVASSPTNEPASTFTGQAPKQVVSSFNISPSDGAKSNLSQLRAQAHLAMQNGDDQGVINALQQIIAIEPSDLRTRKQLAALLFSKKRLDLAKVVLLEALSQAPGDSGSRLMLSRIFFKLGNNNQALKVLTDHPYDAIANDELLSFRAALAERIGKYNIAQKDYQLLVNRNPTEAKWWLGLGVSQDKQMLSNDAITSYQQAAELNQLPQQVDSFLQQRIRLLARRS
ncbi:MAG: hypothetical protein WA981_08495 [Glaciecola sp.]